MTAPAVPTVDVGADLEAQIREALQFPCEWVWYQAPNRARDCDDHAEWLVRLTCSMCDVRSTSLICDTHHARLVEKPQLFHCACGHTALPASIVLERL